mmetsp:Transcript_10803/g.15820  ORF Transcript_10803/g.15820 Transcript_10803/m.15820 type:complete len:384 (-) Transcript_10803:796-1947(-)
MWDIIHQKIWQEESIQEESKGFRANGNHIAKFSCKPNNKPQPVDALTPAYGVLIYEKLVKTLGSELTVLRQKAVRTLCEMLQQKKEHAIRAVQAGVVQALFQAYKDEDMDVRRQALLTSSKLAVVPYGCNAILKEDVEGALRQVKESFGDDAETMEYTFMLLANLKSMAGFHVLGKLMDFMIDTLREEANETTAKVHVQALHALRLSLMIPQNHELAHENQIMSVLGKLIPAYQDLQHVDALQAIGFVLAKLGFQKKGVEEAVQWKIIPLLVPLMHTDFYSLLEPVSQALMFFMLSVEGKRQAAASGLPSQLVTLFPNVNEAPILINLLKITSGLSELPEARETMQPLIPLLEKAMIPENVGKHEELLRESYKRTTALVKWIP